jgi:hypothetical protein
VCKLYTAIRTHCEAFMPGMADDALDAIAELHRVSHTLSPEAWATSIVISPYSTSGGAQSLRPFPCASQAKRRATRSPPPVAPRSNHSRAPAFSTPPPPPLPYHAWESVARGGASSSSSSAFSSAPQPATEVGSHVDARAPSVTHGAR